MSMKFRLYCEERDLYYPVGSGRCKRKRAEIFRPGVWSKISQADGTKVLGAFLKGNTFSTIYNAPMIVEFDLREVQL